LRGHELLCPGCGFTYFHNVAAAVGVFLSRPDGRALFTRRVREPRRGLLGLPGGFVDPGESLEAALARECREEIGLDLKRASFLCSFSNTYEYKGILYNTCDAYFTAEWPVTAGAPLLQPDEVAEAVWLLPAEARPELIAFDSLKRALGPWSAQGAGQ
jgi:ADP-ribose pyrophosphatase YjhB (NUDIX family)